MDLLLSSDAIISSTRAFLPLGKSDHVVFSVSIDFWSNSKADVLFHHIDFDCSFGDWDGLYDYLRDAPWQNIFRISASVVASKFCE